MRTTTLLLLLFTAHLSWAQQIDRTITCGTDTVTVREHWGDLKAFICQRGGDFGARIELGYTNYYHSIQTRQWLGQYGGPNFGLILAYRKLNVGIRFKPATVIPQQNLVFNNDTLIALAKLNPVRIDYFAGYSFDFKYNFSIEPYLGYSRNSFHVINEADLNTTYQIEPASGMIAGISVNKYFKLKKKYQFLAVFGNLGYATTQYQSTHPQLDNGYWEWTLGIAYKGFWEKVFYKWIK